MKETKRGWKGRYDLIVLFTGLLLIALLSKAGILEPWWGPMAFIFDIPVAFLLAVICVWYMGDGIKNPATRKNSVRLSLLVVAACCVVACAPMNRWAWKLYYFQHQAAYERALGKCQANQNSEGRSRIDLDSKDRHLAEWGKVECFVDDSGQRWFLFIVDTVDIDNSVGFVWNEKGLPPPEKTFGDSAWTHKLSKNWLLIRTS